MLSILLGYNHCASSDRKQISPCPKGGMYLKVAPPFSDLFNTRNINLCLLRPYSPSGIKPPYISKKSEPNPEWNPWVNLHTHNQKPFFFGYRKALFPDICLSVGRIFFLLGGFFAGFLAARDHDKSPGFIPLGLLQLPHARNVFYKIRANPRSKIY